MQILFLVESVAFFHKIVVMFKVTDEFISSISDNKDMIIGSKFCSFVIK